MKKIVKKIFKNLGYDVSKSFDENEIKNLTFDEIYKLKIKKNPVILDIGANEGQSIHRFLKTFENPIIHAFEPNKNEFNSLKKNFSSNKNIILNNSALGEKKDIREFNITSHSGNSSFIPINLDTDWIKKRSKQVGIDAKDYIQRKENINIDTVDNYLTSKNINHVDLMKIDTQLFEDKVLEGSKNLLQSQKVDAIEVEVVFSDAYKKYFSMSDIEKFLIPNKYRFSAINLHNNNLFSGTIFFADVLYLNKEKFNI